MLPSICVPRHAYRHRQRHGRGILTDRESSLQLTSLYYIVSFKQLNLTFFLYLDTNPSKVQGPVL